MAVPGKSGVPGELLDHVRVDPAERERAAPVVGGEVVEVVGTRRVNMNLRMDVDNIFLFIYLF